jgi:hypothetical protein
MYVYSGPLLHGIAPWPYTKASDSRLAVVAFMYLCERNWVLSSNPTIIERQEDFDEMLREAGVL